MDCLIHENIIINEKIELRMKIKQFIKVDLEQIELQNTQNMNISDKKIIENDIIYQITFLKEGCYKLLIDHLNKTVKQMNIEIKQNFQIRIKNNTIYLQNQLVNAIIHKMIVNDCNNYQEYVIDDLVYKHDVYQVYLNSSDIPNSVQVQWFREGESQININEINVIQTEQEEDNKLKVNYEYLGIQSMGQVVDYKVNIRNISQNSLQIMVNLNQEQQQTFIIGGQIQKVLQLMSDSIFSMKLILVPTQVGLQPLPQINIFQYKQEWILIHQTQKNIFIQP